ncbi:MAG: hypothetical protein ACE5E5_04070 [Phycisphaerae bacterium]
MNERLKPRPRAYRSLPAVLAASLLATAASAAPPADPLPRPLYSFDAQSPKVLDGSVPADALLRLDFPIPMVAVSGAALGLGQPGDQLDALSTSNAGFPTDAPLALLFSVDRTTLGLTPPDPVLEAQHLPYNAFDQATKGQAAGDQYMSLELFTRAGGIVPAQGGVAASTPNNTLVGNNYDEGGTDFSADPPTSADQSSTDPQDNVNSTLTDPTLAVAGVPIQGVFFSANRESPSLPNLPNNGPPSGASIFFATDPGGAASETILFASPSAMGLDTADDINGLIVFDDNANGLYDGTDHIIFTLAPGSPSIGVIPGSSPVGGAADVFIARLGLAPEVLAPAQVLGLGAAPDNIDALMFLPCGNAFACAADHAIRDAEVPTISEWGVVVMLMLLVLAATIAFAQKRAQREPA